ncbi:hypothetical protein Tco_0682892 [Tanacetum coccineum]|uniref:Uncharacterized protein n=1 Tax=Tanacetum coccineum TaxID=301880 RepID=A0ABQ4XSJ7_9ASTR
MSDVEDARAVDHVSTNSEKEVNNLKEHGPNPNRVDDVYKDKRSMIMDLQDGDSKSEVEEYDNETAQFIASSYKRHGGGTNYPYLRELDEYDFAGLRMFGSDTIKLDRMDGMNFTRWKEKMKFLLTAFKVYYVLEGPPIGVMTEEE